jgi:hypothetical protein
MELMSQGNLIIPQKEGLKQHGKRSKLLLALASLCDKRNILLQKMIT